MSDNEDYFSDGSNEDIESSDDEKIQIIKNPINKNTVEDIIINSDEEDDEEEEDDDESKVKEQNDYYDEDEDQDGGGVDGDSSEDYESEDDENEDNSANLPASSVAKAKKTKITIDPVLDEDEIEDDDDDDDENYLQKFDSEISKNYISEQHPECAIHNYDEIAKLAIIVRDNDNVIVDPLHQTLPFMTKYERARVLGQRTKQIECGANPLIKVPEGIIDAHIIAELELQQQKIPFIIRRPLPGGGSEYWNLKDLENILF